MQYEGWAFKPNEEELRDQNSKRYEEIKHLSQKIRIEKMPLYGRTDFSGEIPEGIEVSEFDLALLADHGNLCFGGRCTITGSRFRGHYWTD